MIYTKPEPGKPILVEIGNSMLELRYSLRALKRLDTEHGVSFLKGGDGILNALKDPAKLAVVLHEGLLSRNPNVSLEWVEDSVDAAMIVELFPMLAYAATGRWVDTTALNAESPNALEPASTGSTSGR